MGLIFFKLFSKETLEKKSANEIVSLEQVKEKWHDIDTEKSGLITKQQAATYITAQKKI